MSGGGVQRRPECSSAFWLIRWPWALILEPAGRAAAGSSDIPSTTQMVMGGGTADGSGFPPQPLPRIVYMRPAEACGGCSGERAPRTPAGRTRNQSRLPRRPPSPRSDSQSRPRRLVVVKAVPCPVRDARGPSRRTGPGAAALCPTGGCVPPRRRAATSGVRRARGLAPPGYGAATVERRDERRRLSAARIRGGRGTLWRPQGSASRAGRAVDRGPGAPGW